MGWTRAPARWADALVPLDDGPIYRCHVQDLRLPATLEMLAMERVHCVEQLDGVLVQAPRLRKLELTSFGNQLVELDVAALTALVELSVPATPLPPSSLVSTSLRSLTAGDPETPRLFTLGQSASLRGLPNMSELYTLGNLCVDGELDVAARQLRGLTMLECSDGCWTSHLPRLTSLTSLALHGWQDTEFDGLEVVPPPSLMQLRILGEFTENRFDPHVGLDLKGCARLELLVLEAVNLEQGSFGGLTTALRHLEMSECFLGQAELRSLPASLRVLKLRENRVVDSARKEVRRICLADLPAAVHGVCELS